jgi:hypothetical protein
MILDLRVIHLVLKYDSTTHMIRWKLAGRASTFRIARMLFARFYSSLQRSLGACPGRGFGRLRGPRHHLSRHKMIDPDLVIGNDVSMDEVGSVARLREIAWRFSELEYVEAVGTGWLGRWRNFGLAIRLRSLCLLSPPRERGVSRKPAQASGPKA